ncbi:MAG: histidine phosphatase family protein [Candidatus Kariarchaeaceae archaeon]|jgi:broad specificity phosphatase PhoE
MIVTPVTLYLIRNGTDASDALQKFGDDRLTTEGIDQATKIANILENQGITLLYTSPSKPARETADIISDAISVSVSEDPRIRSRDLGEVNGLTYNQVSQRYSALLNKSRFDRAWGFPGGETNFQIYERAKSFANQLLQISSGRREKIAIISHNMVMNFLIYGLQGLPYQEKMFYLFEGGSFSVMERAANDFGMKYFGKV